MLRSAARLRRWQAWKNILDLRRATDYLVSRSEVSLQAAAENADILLEWSLPRDDVTNSPPAGPLTPAGRPGPAWRVRPLDGLDPRVVGHTIRAEAALRCRSANTQPHGGEAAGMWLGQAPGGERGERAEAAQPRRAAPYWANTCPGRIREEVRSLKLACLKNIAAQHNGDRGVPAVHPRTAWASRQSRRPRVPVSRRLRARAGH